MLVKFRPGVSQATEQRALVAAGARDLRTITDIGVHVLSVPAASASRAFSALKRETSVAFTERDGIAKPQETLPDNPYLPQGTYALSGGGWGWWQTHTTQAWDVTQGSPTVVIAILDTGLRPQGLNFGSQVVPGWNVMSGTSDTTTNAGVHGTYVAGVAVQAFDDGIGNAGYCARCDVMPVQVGTDSGASYSDMATGITWAADHGAQIENLSWAGTTSSSTLASAVSYARSKGVVVFAAAGNSNCNCPTWPAATPGVLGVGGVGNTGSKASDSNYGSWVALAAPEGNMTAWPTMNGAPGYGPVGGTSLASPAAAGIAGLLLSADPGLTGSQLEQTLESTASPVPFQVASGEVDAMAALRSLGFSDPQPPAAPANASPPEILAETNGAYNATPLTAAPQVGQVLMRDQGSWSGSSPLTLSGIAWERCSGDGSGCTTVGTSSTYTVQSADIGYSLRLSVTMSDPSGSSSALSAPSGIVTGPTTVSSPASSAPPSVSGTAQAGQTLTASAGTWTNSPTGYAYQWNRCDSSGAGCVGIAGATGSAYAATTSDVGSTLTVTVTASNSAGSGSSTSAPTTTVAAAPSAPVAMGTPAVSGTAESGQTLTASTGTWTNSPTAYAFQWNRCDSSGANCIGISGATGSTYVPASTDVGSTLTVTVTASNSAGSSSATSNSTAVVQAGNQTLSFSGSFGAKGSPQSFTASLGAGTATASLAYAKCSSSLTIALKAGSSTIASVTGPSVLTLSQSVASGTYTYTVSGGTKCSFTLTVSSPAP